MAKSTNQKAKILYLEKILQGTDETHPCTMQEILGRLQEYGISAERKSIYDDMEVLLSLIHISFMAFWRNLSVTTTRKPTE